MKLSALGLNSDERALWEAWQAGHLVLRGCSRCGQVTHPPLPMCPACGSTAWSLVEVPTHGRVHSWISADGRGPQEPHSGRQVIALVELLQGTRLVTNVVDVDASSVRNEMTVELFLGAVDGLTLPLCRPHVGAP